MNDEEKLNDLFEDNENGKLKKLIRKAKIVSIIRTVVITLVVLLIAGFGLCIVNAILMNKIGNDKMTTEELFNTIAQPNSYISMIRNNDGFMSGEVTYSRYKIVYNKPVLVGEYKIPFNIIPILSSYYGDWSDSLASIVEKGYRGERFDDERIWARYDQKGNRWMSFYHPAINYEQESYRQDLNLLDEIGQDKYIEMALSFDRRYSINEVEKMIPDSLVLNWYWVDTYSEGTLKEMRTHQTNVLDINGKKVDTYFTTNRIEYENGVYGIKAITMQGEKIKEPHIAFIDAIQFGMERNSHYQGEFKRIYNTLRKGKSRITKDDLKIIGVVVSGDANSLQQLRNKPFIKASSLGATVDKY